MPLCEPRNKESRVGIGVLKGSSLRRGSTQAFTAIAALSVALRIGVNTAMFAFHDVILLRPLPVQEPGSSRLQQPVTLRSRQRKHLSVCRLTYLSGARLPAEQSVQALPAALSSVAGVSR
jgi:hypothetical protein